MGVSLGFMHNAVCSLTTSTAADYDPGVPGDCTALTSLRHPVPACDRISHRVCMLALREEDLQTDATAEG